MLNLVSLVLILLRLGLLFTPRRRLAPPLLGLGVLLFLLANSFVVVPAGHVGVVFNILRGVQERPLYEGIHFVVPGLQQVLLYDARVKEVTLSAPHEGERRADTWLAKAHITARRPPTRMRVSASFPPLPRSQKDGLEGRKISRHLAPEERKESAYPQDPPGISARGVPSAG
jgi:hypothetical protein